MPLTLPNLLAMDPSQILYTVVLPFVIAFTIFWGLLTAMRLFSSKINTIIAFVLATGLFFTDAYLFIGQFIFASGTFLAAGLFILIFVFGTISWAFSRGRSIYKENIGYENELKNINKQIEKLTDKINRSTGQEKAHYESEIGKLLQKKQVLEAQLKAIRGY